MSETEVTFSEYAMAFYKIIYDSTPQKDIFMKEFLKIGLNDNERRIINSIFPTITNDKGKRIIKKNKDDRLRKYLRGGTGIGDLVNELGWNLDSEFKRSYSRELRDFDESKLIKFANEFELDFDEYKYEYEDEDEYEYEDSISQVSEAIAELYVSILKAEAKKRTKAAKSKVNLKTNKNNIVGSYTLTTSEKQALINICKQIKAGLKPLKSLATKISNKSHELKNLTNSAANKRWKEYLQVEIESSVKQFGASYSMLERFCSDLSAFLKPRTNMAEGFPELMSYADNISDEQYKSINSDDFDFSALLNMISKFNDKIDKILPVIDKL